MLLERALDVAPHGAVRIRRPVVKGEERLVLDGSVNVTQRYLPRVQREPPAASVATLRGDQPGGPQRPQNPPDNHRVGIDAVRKILGGSRFLAVQREQRQRMDSHGKASVSDHFLPICNNYSYK